MNKTRLPSVLPFTSEKYIQLRSFEELKPSQKKEAFERVKLLVRDINTLKSNKDIISVLSNQDRVRAMFNGIKTIRQKEASIILKELLLTLSIGDINPERKEPLRDATEWFKKLMRSQDVELEPIFSSEEFWEYWAPYMQSHNLVEITENDEKVNFDLETRTEIIIWHLAQAKAYCLYGIHLGYPVSRDQIADNLNIYKKVSEANHLDIANEINDLLELIYFRMSIDTGEDISIEELSILSGIDKRSISNASIAGEKKGYLVPARKGKRKMFRCASAENWLLNRKKNKYTYLPSIKHPGDHHFDGHISIPANNLDELYELYENFTAAK